MPPKDCFDMGISIENPEILSSKSFENEPATIDLKEVKFYVGWMIAHTYTMTPCLTNFCRIEY